MRGTPDVDLHLLQWHTPNSAVRNCHKHPRDVVDQRARELEQVRNWLSSLDATSGGDRPLFIVAPELSLARSLLPRVEEMVNASRRRTIFIAGLEYLTIAEFDAMVAANPDMACGTNMDGGWLSNRGYERYVNCAAVITNCRVGGGSFTQHLQVKRHPFREEQHDLALGRHTLVFSEAAVSGPERREPLDFIVQICSDFVNEDAVAALRAELSELNTHTRVDLLFLLQWNQNQRAGAFARCLNTFYNFASGQSNDLLTAALFVNNAAPRHERATELGGSCLVVHHDKRFTGPGQNPHVSYYERPREDADHFQALVFREDGPSIQRFQQFRLLRDLNRAPGQWGNHPVRKADCARLLGDGGPLDFQEFSGTGRWLEDEWRLDGPVLADMCAGELPGRDPALSSFVHQAHATHSNRWVERFRHRERPAREFLQEFTIVPPSGRVNYPSEMRREPMHWDPRFGQTVGRQLRAAVLLEFAATLEGLQFVPLGEPMRHAQIGDETSVSFHCGNHEWECADLARELQRSGLPLQISDSRRHVYVFVDATRNPSVSLAELNAEAI